MVLDEKERRSANFNIFDFLFIKTMRHLSDSQSSFVSPFPTIFPEVFSEMAFADKNGLAKIYSDNSLTFRHFFYATFTPPFTPSFTPPESVSISLLTK